MRLFLISIILIVLFSGCEKNYPLGIYFDHSIPDSLLIINDSVNVIINYCVPDTNNNNYNYYSYICTVYQSLYNEPDYIINVPRDNPTSYKDTIRIINKCSFYVIYHYYDSLKFYTDTLYFNPYNDSIYSFGFNNKP